MKEETKLWKRRQNYRNNFVSSTMQKTWMWGIIVIIGSVLLEQRINDQWRSLMSMIIEGKIRGKKDNRRQTVKWSPFFFSKFPNVM